MSVQLRFFSIIFLLLPALSFAQQTDAKYSFGFNAGVYVYQGDLTPERFGSYRTMKPGISLWASKAIVNNISIRGNISIASLKGDESKYDNPDWRKQRNLKFTTPLKEFSLQAVWDVQSIIPRVSTYLFAGIGYSFLNIHRDYSGFNAVYFSNQKNVIDGLATDVATKPPRGIPVVPVGAGVRYSLNNNFSIHAETAYSLTSTDYLDGFSKVANPDRFDHYQSISVGLMYSLAKMKNLDCPRF
jgi:hypothetical protein